MPFSIERNDLAKVEADAIVVAANEALQITGGVGEQVGKAAGLARLQAACDAIGYCPTGGAVVTPGFDLPASIVVHAVGPQWTGGRSGEVGLLRSAYDNALRRAVEAGAHSIAVPLISAGTYGFPPDVSLSVASDAIRAFLVDHDAEVRLILHDRASLVDGLSVYGNVAAYVDGRYVAEQPFRRSSASGWSGGGVEAVRGEPLMPAPPQRSIPGGAPSYGASAPYDEGRFSLEAASEPRGKRKRGLASRIGELLSGREKERTRFGGEASYSAQERESERQSEATYAATPADAAYGAQPFKESLQADELREEDACIDDALPEAVAFGRDDRFSRLAETRRIELSDFLDALDEPFSTTLLALIDARGMTDVEVYKRANMSRQLFSKIRADASYRPTKKTVLALAIALRLDLGETDDLLRRAGFALSRSSKADCIVEYFILTRNYDIFEINETLYAFDQPLL